MKDKFMTSLLGAIPLILPIGVLLVMRSALSPCSKENNCEGILLIGVAALGASLSFALYWIDKNKGNKIFSPVQRKRLLIGTALWIGLIALVLGEIAFRSLK